MTCNCIYKGDDAPNLIKIVLKNIPDNAGWVIAGNDYVGFREY